MAIPDNGGLSAGGRFERMEAALTRIEQKLDSKVDWDDLRPLMHRVELLESGETPLGRVLLGQFEGMQKSLNDLALHGSASAQEAGRRVGDLETEVATLKSGREADVALLDERREGFIRRNKTWTLAIAVLSALAIIVSAASAVVVATH